MFEECGTYTKPHLLLINLKKHVLYAIKLTILARHEARPEVQRHRFYHLGFLLFNKEPRPPLPSTLSREKSLHCTSTNQDGDLGDLQDAREAACLASHPQEVDHATREITGQAWNDFGADYDEEDDALPMGLGLKTALNWGPVVMELGSQKPQWFLDTE